MSEIDRVVRRMSVEVFEYRLHGLIDGDRRLFVDRIVDMCECGLTAASAVQDDSRRVGLEHAFNALRFWALQL